MNQTIQEQCGDHKIFNKDEIVDTHYLDKILLQDGKLVIISANEYDKIPQDHLVMWCHRHGVYNIPTAELIEWLKLHVVPNETIEIGAGMGLGRHLGIPMTDSCYMKNNMEVRLSYLLMDQPITEYPSDIIEMDAVTAISHYKPSVVIGCWITHRYDERRHGRGGNKFGVDEKFVLDNVKKYIMVGNESVHEKKPLLGLPHKTFRFPWVRSRSVNPTKNVIYMWEQ